MRRPQFVFLPFWIFAFEVSSLVSEKAYECPKKQEMYCEELRTIDGFTYPVPLTIPNSGDCEQAWYMNGSCIAHSDGEKLSFVMEVTLANLTIGSCEDLQWELRCDLIMFYCFINYTVTKPAGKPQDHGKITNTFAVGAVIGIFSLVLVSVAFIVIWSYCRRCRKSKSHYNGVEDMEIHY